MIPLIYDMDPVQKYYCGDYFRIEYVVTMLVKFNACTKPLLRKRDIQNYTVPCQTREAHTSTTLAVWRPRKRKEVLLHVTYPV